MLRVLAHACAITLAASTTLHCVASPRNDLWARLVANPQPFALQLHASLPDALQAASPGDALAVLVDGRNSSTGIRVDASAYAALAAANLRGVYIEMPLSLPPGGSDLAPPANISYLQRMVVLSGDMPGLAPLDILSVNAPFCVDFSASPHSSQQQSLATLGVVAGSDSAVYGPPPLNASLAGLLAMPLSPAPGSPLLLVAAFAASSFRSSRLSPADRWDALLNFVVGNVTGSGASFNGVSGWVPRLHPLLDSDTTRQRAAAIAGGGGGGPVPQPAGYEVAALLRGTDWLASPVSGMLILGDNTTCQAPYWPGSRPLLACMLEGVESEISQGSGAQAIAGDLRADCNAEAGMAFAVRALWEAAEAKSADEGAAVGLQRQPPTQLRPEQMRQRQIHRQQLSLQQRLRQQQVPQQQQQMHEPQSPQQQQQMQQMEHAAAAHTRTPLQTTHHPFAADAPADAAQDDPTAPDWPVLGLALLNYTFLFSSAQQGPARGNRSHGAYGIVSWFSTPSSDPDAWSQYGDDNARVMDAAIVACAALRSSLFRGAWDSDCHAIEDGVIKSLLGNLRTTSRSGGFRYGRLNGPDFDDGWERLWLANVSYDTDPVYPQPHYQAQLWSTFIWAYGVTRWQPFLDTVLVALNATMSFYAQPPLWMTTEYESEEQARLALTLAWLLRVELQSPPGGGGGVNATHVAWLLTVTDDYIAHQSNAGGIRETLGVLNQSWCPPPSSNAAYGTGEAPLIQRDGDTITDQLYSNNFGLVALVEAAAAMRECAQAPACVVALPTAAQAAARYQLSADLLASYLSAIQAVAEDVGTAPLNGTWPRAFDYAHWDYWGSASDSGWGPWSVETGWTMTWTSSVLGLRALGTTFWELSMGGTGITGQRVAAACPDFFPREVCGGGGG